MSDLKEFTLVLLISVTMILCLSFDMKAQAESELHEQELRKIRGRILSKQLTSDQLDRFQKRVLTPP